jgi:hypothetical protein
MNSFYSPDEFPSMYLSTEIKAVPNSGMRRLNSRTNCNNVWHFVLPVCFGGLIALSGSLLTGNITWLAAFPVAVMLACHLVTSRASAERIAKMVDLKGWTRWWRDSSAVRSRQQFGGE